MGPLRGWARGTAAGTIERMTSFRFSMLFALVVIPACSSIVSPDPSRLGGGTDGGGGGLDAPLADVPMIENDVPEGSDVPAVSPDVPGPLCAVACEDGTVCVGGECQCPDGVCCPGCADDELCLGGECFRCGHDTESCCTGEVCVESDLACVEGDCVSCGDVFEPCCADGGCSGGATCTSGICRRDDCGDDGERCCEGRTCATGELACVDPFPVGEPRCRPCGGRGEACCAGMACDSERLVCDGGSCATCGGNTQPCCAGRVCGDGLDCGSTSNRCF